MSLLLLFKQTATGAFTLTCEGASLLLEGKNVNLKVDRNLTATTQTYNEDLKPANLKVDRNLTATTQSYNFTFNQLLFARGGFIKVWNGSAWVSKPLKTWNGTAWVSKPLKVWTGTLWRTY